LISSAERKAAKHQNRKLEKGRNPSDGRRGACLQDRERGKSREGSGFFFSSAELLLGGKDKSRAHPREREKSERGIRGTCSLNRESGGVYDHDHIRRGSLTGV